MPRPTVTETFWLGPFDVRVPVHIGTVPAGDGMNYMDSRGSITKAMPRYMPDEEKYHMEYCTKIGEHWYYTGNKE